MYREKRDFNLSIILIILIMTFFSLPLLAAEAEQKTFQVAILPWSMNQSLQAGGGLVMAELFAGQLRETGFYEVMGTAEIIEKTGGQADLDLACKKTECFKDLKRFLEVDIVISCELIVNEVEDVATVYELKIRGVGREDEKIFLEGQTAGTENDFLDFLKNNIFESFVKPYLVTKDETPADGSMEITSEPEKAAVYLDGEMVGNTPLVLDKIKAGEHKLKLVLAGYEIWEEKFNVKGGERKVLIGSLIEALGVLSVSTSPSNADVFLDGEQMGKTPLEISVPAGEYELEISKKGYAKRRQKIIIPLDKPLEFKTNLLIWLSEEELADLERLRKLKDELKDKIKKEDYVRFKKLEIRKLRRDAELKEIALNDSETVALELSEFVKRHEEACNSKGMVFVRTREITTSDVELAGLIADSKKLRRGFCIDPKEVTVGEYKSLRQDFIPSEYSYKDNSPVTRVTFKQAGEFCRQKNKRLCSREEWSKACQGINGNPYFYGKKFEPERCRTSLKLADGAVEVGSLADCTNDLGIYDMSGNVWEWTNDEYFPNTRVVRGGSWVDKATTCDYLGGADPETEDDTFGFRCCSDYDLEIK